MTGLTVRCPFACVTKAIYLLWPPSVDSFPMHNSKSAFVLSAFVEIFLKRLNIFMSFNKFFCREIANNLID